MPISLVVAMDKNRLIGSNGKMPWRLPADTRYFRNLTMHHTVVMGRKTYESLNGKPLVGRRNIVLTRQTLPSSPAVITVSSLKDAYALATSHEIFVIGGAEVYRQALPHATRVYATLIDHVFEGDTYFPELAMDEWRERSRYDYVPDKDNLYPYAFVVYERR